jgi:hypothetical protein
MHLATNTAMHSQSLEDMSLTYEVIHRSVDRFRNKRWDKLNEMAARAHSALIDATRFGVHDGNAAEVLRLQLAADSAEAALMRLERRQRGHHELAWRNRARLGPAPQHN